MSRGVRENLQPSVIGYLLCFVFSVLMAMLTPGWRVGLACLAATALALVFYRAGLEPLRRVWLWVLLALLVGSSAWLGDDGEGLAAGIQMAFRTVTIVIAATGFAASVSIGELTELLEQAGVKGLGFALGVAVNFLPVAQETATTTFHALRLRGGFRREWWRAMRLLLTTIVVNSLRHVEDIVSAAEARAFSTTCARPLHIAWRRGDRILAGVLLLMALAVMLT
jgi:energy-coupling factor transporter transmembrane protein EcfT